MNEQKTVALSRYPKTKAAFVEWYIKRYAVTLAKHIEVSAAAKTHFFDCHFGVQHFDFQQGALLAFLREKGIHAASVPDFTRPAPHCYSQGWVIESGQDLDFRDITRPDYNTALIAAIEAGFARLEEAA